MVFLDESGYLLQPLRRRVWAPAGHTPLQRAWDRRDRITTIAAVTRAPWALRLGMYYELLDHNARTADFVRFVREVHEHLRVTVHEPAEILLFASRGMHRLRYGHVAHAVADYARTDRRFAA